MVSHFDPRTGADGLLHTPRPRTLQSARTIMQTWEQEVAEFEMKYAKKVDEDAKILALKSIMHETFLGESGVFRGRSFNFYVELRTAIINYSNDKVTNINNEHGSDFEIKEKKAKTRR